MFTHHMEQLLCTALMTVDYLTHVVPRGQRTMKLIVDGVDFVGEACPHVLNSILWRKYKASFSKNY